MSNGAFSSPRTLAAVAGCAAVAFVASMLLTLAGDGGGLERAGANSSSRSAVGHLGFYELLGKLGYAVSRDSGDKLADDAVLLLLEPGADAASRDLLERLKDAKLIFLALPKRRVHADPLRADWIDAATLAPIEKAQSVLSTFVKKAEVLRVAKPAPFKTNMLGREASVAGVTQLVKGGAIEPIVAADDGVLLGEIRQGGRRVVILADPDPLENHGLGLKENPEFLAALMPALSGDKARLIFKEAIHGAGAKPPADLLRLLTEFPYNLTLLQLFIALALLLAATTRRFGAPLTPPPPLSAGKRALIGNIARLLEFGGHRRALLQRYVEIEVKDAAQRLRAPRGLTESALIDWLARIGAARGVTEDCGAILAQARGAKRNNSARAFRAARAIHDWKAEILDGRFRHSQPH